MKQGIAGEDSSLVAIFHEEADAIFRVTGRMKCSDL
jgi:hypothetical protein